MKLSQENLSAHCLYERNNSKNVIRYQAVNLYRKITKYEGHNISFENVFAEYHEEYGKCDTYPILQYHFKAFDYIFSVNDFNLGKALWQISNKIIM